MKKAVLISILFLTGFKLFAQQNRPVTFGLSTSVNMGHLQDRIELTPTASLNVLPKTYLGLGTTLAYYSNENKVYDTVNNVTKGFKIEDKVWYYGAQIFIRYQPWENKETLMHNIFLQSSYEYLHGRGKYHDKSGKYSYKTNNNSILAGPGYRQALSDRFNLNMGLFFKMNNEKDSPYRNPIVRVSFEF